MLPNIISAVAENDPARAAQMTFRLSGEAQTAAATSIISQWAASDPQAAGSWAASFPEGKTRDQVFENLINRWAKSDPAAAASWLGNLSDSPSRDQAVSAFTNRISSSDPQAAVQWAATISNDSLRDSQMESTARAWLKADPRNASTWISNSSLPDDTKSAVAESGRLSRLETAFVEGDDSARGGGNVGIQTRAGLATPARQSLAPPGLNNVLLNIFPL